MANLHIDSGYLVVVTKDGYDLGFCKCMESMARHPYIPSTTVLGDIIYGVTEISESVSQFHKTLLDGLEGVGDGEPYTEPSQQVEEAEVTGESYDCTPMAKGATFDPGL